MADTALIITCEHGGHRVPECYRTLFKGKRDLLESHRGYDPGALGLSLELSRRLECRLFFSTFTRLLVDLNRSPGNPRIFSEVTRGLPPADRLDIIKQYYAPYRKRVSSAISDELSRGRKVLHLSVHSFVPEHERGLRIADIGILYDPRRIEEATFALDWQWALAASAPELRVRRNYPYRGVSDGFTTHLRGRLPQGKYLGIELEVNQKHPLGERRRDWNRLENVVVNSLAIVLKRAHSM